MELILYNNRKVLKEGYLNISAGTQYENIATSLEINTKHLNLMYNNENLKVSDCTMVIHFWQTSGDSIGNAIVSDNTYYIENNVTKYEKVYAQIQLIYEDMDWRSDKFLLKFGDSISEDDELDEAELSVLNTLIESYNTSVTELSNLNITATKEDGVTTITITDKDGNSTSVTVEDGAQGEQGVQGVQGKQGIQGEKGDAYTITEDDYEAIASIVTDSATSTFNEVVASATETYNTNAEEKIAEYNENASELIAGLDKKEPKHSIYRMDITEDIAKDTEITVPAEYVLDSNLVVFYCGERLLKDTHYTEIDENTISLLFDVSYSEMYNKYIDFLIKEAE